MPRNEKKSGGGEKGEKEEDGKVGGKKAGKAALGAARRMAETATDVFRFLEARGKTGAQVITQMEDHEAIILAQITKNPGGGRMQVVLRDGTVPDPVRICRPLQVKGRANPKAWAQIMRVGDVAVIVKGDIEGKLTPAQCARAQTAMERLGIPFTRGFFTSSRPEEADVLDEVFTFDREAEAIAEERAEEARQLVEARAWAVFNGTEVPLTFSDIARVKADYDAKRLAAAVAREALLSGSRDAAALVAAAPKPARGGAGGPAEEDLEATVVAKKGLVGFAALAAAAKKEEKDSGFSFE